MKYTRESALNRLRRNEVEIKVVKKPKDPKKPLGDTIVIHYISTKGLGIKLQGTADYLINNYYDMTRA